MTISVNYTGKELETLSARSCFECHGNTFVTQKVFGSKEIQESIPLGSLS